MLIDKDLLNIYIRDNKILININVGNLLENLIHNNIYKACSLVFTTNTKQPK